MTKLDPEIKAFLDRFGDIKKMPRKELIRLSMYMTEEIQHAVAGCNYAGVGTARISIERKRQMDELGFDIQHDEQWDDHQLLRAAGCYLRAAQEEVLNDDPPIDTDWPWDLAWFKPLLEDGEEGEVDTIRCLEKAGALIAAEIDRLRTAAYTEVFEGEVESDD